MDLMILISQTFCTGFLALWLTSGVRDNLCHPRLNEVITSEVFDLSRLRADFPEAYALVAYRRITSKRVRQVAFRVIVAWELLATSVLWIGVGALGLAVAGIADPGAARVFGMAGALMFTATWALF